MKKKAVILLLVICFLLLKPASLFAGGGAERRRGGEPPPPAARALTLQERYDVLAAPGIIMLPINGISAVSSEVIQQIERELLIRLIDDGRLRPVRMQTWLLSTFETRANNPFIIMNDIRAERYALPLQLIARPFVFRNGRHYFFVFSIYSLAAHYPITIFRKFSSLDMIDDMIASSVEEMHIRLPHIAAGGRRRVVIEDFRLDFYRLVTHPTGEFDFLTTPFIERDGITFRDGDDFFSHVMGYILETTGLFQVLRLGDFREFSNTIISPAANLADYRLQGRVQISDFECVLHINLIEVRTGAQLISLQYPLLSYSFDAVWDAYRQLSVQIIEKIFDSEAFNIVPALTAARRNFFSNNMFIGYNKLENYVLGRGLYVIYTGPQFRKENSIGSRRTFYILSDNRITVFENTEGRQIWNLLSK